MGKMGTWFPLPGSTWALRAAGALLPPLVGFCDSGFSAAEAQALEGRVRLGATENGFGTAGATATVLPAQVTSRGRLSPNLPRDPLQESPELSLQD